MEIDEKLKAGAMGALDTGNEQKHMLRSKQKLLEEQAAEAQRKADRAAEAAKARAKAEMKAKEKGRQEEHDAPPKDDGLGKT